MDERTKTAVAGRLARIEGQIRGVAQLVEQNRDGLDVVAHVRAARSALAKVEQLAPANHLAHCVEEAIVSGDPDKQRQKVAELIDVFRRSER